ncbi:uncharacterized protein KY384_005196 [Bacidia gigantensis]|uniref:uncharacterized protein n=1 Tax=Bacidia gigantensis TaxID=2732470 RepID=UPI001D03976F|nr:uncharacterized protein KY384_005196 [Bacidia gigantensis]KAG8529715.1 hypothetical protein KY384_005196 [Bacidia gigantensis]
MGSRLTGKRVEFTRRGLIPEFEDETRIVDDAEMYPQRAKTIYNDCKTSRASLTADRAIIDDRIFHHANDFKDVPPTITKWVASAKVSDNLVDWTMGENMILDKGDVDRSKSTRDEVKQAIQIPTTE